MKEILTKTTKYLQLAWHSPVYVTSSDPQTRPVLFGHVQLEGAVGVVVGSQGHGPVHITFLLLNTKYSLIDENLLFITITMFEYDGRKVAM